MFELLSYFLAVFVSLFIIVDAIGNIPIFNSLLEKFSEKEKINVITKSIIISFTVLIVLSIFGNGIFEFFKIQMYSFKMAGGILLFIIAVEMLFGKKTKTEYSHEEGENAKKLEEIATMPLAIPLLTGPGAITTGLILYSGAGTIEEKAIFTIAAICVFSAAYFILKNSTKIFKYLKAPRSAIIARVMGLLLSAIAVQFITDGIIEFVKIL